MANPHGDRKPQRPRLPGVTTQSYHIKAFACYLCGDSAEVRSRTAFFLVVIP